MKKLALIFCILISACSFKPLNSYLQDEQYNVALAKVKIGKIDSKFSYILKDALEEVLNPENLELEKKYSLDVKITSLIEDLLVQKDSNISRKEIKFDTTYVVKNLDTSKLVKSDNFPIAVSYAWTNSIYSTYVNEEYSYKNGLKEIARQLRLRVILAITKDHLHENPSKRVK